MLIEDYLTQKKQSLIDTNKNLTEEKLRVEGAWLVLQEIEEIMTAPKSPKGDFEEEKPKTKTKKTKRGK